MAMCTLIATKTEEGVLVGMNRDEFPERMHSEYVNRDLLYPVDPLKKGTWIGVSKTTGNVAALLSRVELPSERTRGEIVPYVLRTGGLPPKLLCYAPFTLFKYNAALELFYVTTWNRNEVKTYETSNPVVLASGSDVVVAQRTQFLAEQARQIKTFEDLRALLRNHELEMPATVCLHGLFAQTLSSLIMKHDLHDKTIEVYDLVGNPCKEEYKQVRNISYGKGR